MLAATLLAAPAFAQDIIDDDEDAFEEDDFDLDDDDIGLDNTGLTVRGGVSNFTGDLGADTATGAFVGIQADARPVRGVGVELGYEGSRNPLSEADGAMGLEYKFGDVTAGARATYRILGDEEISPVPGDTGNLFNVGLTLGGRF